MADYYTHISTMVTNLTPDEQKWWKRTLEIIKRVCGDEAAEMERMDLLPDEVQVLNAVKNDGIVDWGIDAKVDSEAVWFTDSDGVPNIDGLADLLQLFHQKFRPQGIHTFRWAETCSRPRLDAYGGGVFAITAKEIKAMHVSQAEENAVRSFKETGLVSFEEG